MKDKYITVIQLTKYLKYKIDNDVTVIKTTYKTENDNGTIAIIGPKRMDYERVVSMLEYIKKNIER